MAMSIIEACIFIITHEDDLDNIDEDITNSIICAMDLIDELVEGLKPNFMALANMSVDLSQRATGRGSELCLRCAHGRLCTVG